ncbi:unnamed protein product [Adineta steineri]|uniref:Transcription factor BYE1 n=1 Tax=Adineta steineri TaxID=433720 RepID=A0A813QBM4_9BILA|nr:unnamed protein product [Adineta steineri]
MRPCSSNSNTHDIIDLSIDDSDDDDGGDDGEKSDDNDDQTHRRLWCICQKPWDHSRLMLRCDSCANWYHGDCIGITKEQAKILEMHTDQFICPLCQDVSHSTVKSTDKSILTKRKHSHRKSSKTKEKRVLHNGLKKKLKRNSSFQQDSFIKIQTNCIVKNCNNQSKSDWMYCSSDCIRRHINDTLQSIQRSKGVDNEEIPSREDILLYECKTNKILEKNLVPQIEDLSRWMNQHPSYKILRSSSKQAILLLKTQPKDLTRSLSTINNTNKSKVVSSSITSNIKSIPNKKNPIQVRKQINNKISDNTDDIRSKVTTTLYDKILLRLKKNGEENLINENIQVIINKIEQEMFRVYGKVDNSYKNKFRSLLANISNINNNFFYKQILSNEITAKEIVAMKSEDMLPPEEKEKRKDQFEKEVQMIINAEQQTAEEMARRARLKIIQQGFIDNHIFFSMIKSKEKNVSEDNIDKTKDKQLINSSQKDIDKNSTPIVSISNEKLKLTVSENLPYTPVLKTIDSNESLKDLPSTSITEPTNSSCVADDSDNDYIEPESPTGADALIYDDDEDDLNNNLNQSPTDNTEDNNPYQHVVRDDYNPSKVQNETLPIQPSTSNVRLPNQWRGLIRPSDIKIPCQSVHVYGESNYLIDNIPEQLIILGRLRLKDLWDYIHVSLAIRDIIILTLTSSSSSNTTDNDIFLQYYDIIEGSKRAAVISKCSATSRIRHMYILAADTKDCSSDVLSSLFLPVQFEAKQLFLVIIGTEKRRTKSINRSNENQLLNNLIYKPIALQDTTIIRDPRLLRNKNRAIQSINTETTSVQYANEDLLKLISDSLERMRHSSTTDNICSIFTATTEILKAHKRDDLIQQFIDNHRIALTEWQMIHGNTSAVSTTTVTDDNLIEENMDVDDDDHQDDKNKKQIITSSTCNKLNEFSVAEYHFYNQRC